MRLHQIISRERWTAAGLGDGQGRIVAQFGSSLCATSRRSLAPLAGTRGVGMTAERWGREIIGMDPLKGADVRGVALPVRRGLSKIEHDPAKLNKLRRTRSG